MPCPTLVDFRLILCWKHAPLQAHLVLDNSHPTTALHRRLNLILFLNQEWDHHWGGILDFHSDPWDPDSDQVRSVAPAFNRCVLFETNEYSWHGFRRIVLPEDKRHVSRQTIAVYFYTRERPPEETAPDHSTVYVPRPMPPHIQPGHTLSEDDYSDLRTLYMRNTHQIKFLYDLLANRSDVPAEPDAQVETLLTEIARRRQENARIKEQSDKQEEQIGTYKKRNSGFVVGGWRSAQAGMRQFRDERSRAVSAHPRNRGSLAGGLGGLKAGGRRSPRPSGAP